MSVEKAGKSAGFEAVCFPNLPRDSMRNLGRTFYTAKTPQRTMALSMTRSEVGISEPVPGYPWRSGAPILSSPARCGTLFWLPVWLEPWQKTFKLSVLINLQRLGWEVSS
jgi:hypothetical protein